MTEQRRRTRGDFLLSATFLSALAVLLVNDFVLKPHFPGALSGLLSDLAGMVFFPILLVGAAELVMLLWPGRPYASPRWFVVATIAVAIAFVVVKYTDAGQALYRDVIGRGESSDPLDLLALLLVPVPYLVGRRWRGSPSDQVG